MLSLPIMCQTIIPRCPFTHRAAQFSPFAALELANGDAVEETARLTSQKKILDETEREALDRQRVLPGGTPGGEPGRQTEDVGTFPESGSHIFFRTQKRAGELI